MSLYKVVTGRQETEFIEADSVELNDNNGRLNLMRAGELVGSFVGYSSCNIVEEVAPPSE